MAAGTINAVSASANAPLLESGFMSRLDRLDVVSRKVLAGKMRGERRSKRRGQSVEFADFRNYTEGDDLRFIDWNIYARLEKLFLKLFLEEEDLSLHIIIDTSASMNFGQPNKAWYAKRVAAALGYIGLVNYNRVNLVSIGSAASGGLNETGGLRGRRTVARMMAFLENLQTDTGLAEGSKPQSPSAGVGIGGGAGGGDFTSGLKRFASMHRSRGVVVVLSDFFDKRGYEAGLRYVATGRYDLFAIQLLSPQEMDPDIKGDLKLKDVEDADEAEVSVSPELIKKYKANLAGYCNGLKTYLTRRGSVHLFTSTAVGFDTLVLNYLREKRLLG